MTKNSWIKVWIILLAVEALVFLFFGVINAPMLAVLIRGTIAAKTAAAAQVLGGIITLFIGK